MSDPKDRLFRHLALLRLIPREPRSISTAELLQRLRAEQFDLDLRTLQRDLTGRLGLDFPLLCDESQRPYRWSFPKNTPQFDLPALDTPTALAFALAESHLAKLLPPSVLNLLAPHFELAQRQLQGLQHNTLAHWAKHVRAVPNGKALQPAPIEDAVWSDVAAALLEARQLDIVYQSRSKGDQKTLRIHPAGIVSRHSVSYLLGTVAGYNDVRQFALHRIHQAKCLEEAAHVQADFEIDHYLQGGGFNSVGPVAHHTLIADVAPSIAWLLKETPLSAEQTLTPLPGSDWQRLHAQVPDDQETFWWVFGLGESIHLHQPVSWTQAIAEKLSKMTALYTPDYARQEAQ